MNKASRTNRQETALITGASGGIGYEFAKLCAQDGYNLVLVARSEGKLNDIANKFKENFGVAVKVIAKDLSKPTAAEEIFSETQQENINVDVLINNAGFATYGQFTEIDINAELQMIQVNVTCLTYLSKLYAKSMAAQKKGKILNVASTAAFQPGPLMAVYYATKAYVLSFSEAIGNELRDVGVTVTALCPGPTESGFQERAKMEDSKLVSGRKIMDAETVAKIGYRGLMEGEAVVIPGLKNQLLATAVRFLPRNVVTQMVRDTQEAEGK